MKEYFIPTKECLMEAATNKYLPQTISIGGGDHAKISMVNPDETEQLIQFLQKISEETTHTLQYPGRSYSHYAIQQRITRTAQSDTDLLLKVEHQNMFIAHLDFQTQNEHHPWVKHVARFGMAVLEEYQSQGIGSTLIQSALQWAEKTGITRVETLIQTDNTVALELCKRFGFAIEGLRHNSLCIHDTYKDEYYLARTSDP